MSAQILLLHLTEIVHSLAALPFGRRTSVRTSTHSFSPPGIDNPRHSKAQPSASLSAIRSREGVWFCRRTSLPESAPPPLTRRMSQKSGALQSVFTNLVSPEMRFTMAVTANPDPRCEKCIDIDSFSTEIPAAAIDTADTTDEKNSM